VAFKELLDRALDKPKEQGQEIHVSGEIELTARLTAARTRIIDLTATGTGPALAEKVHG
jgi:ATP phosphoribosyltransferase